MKRARELVSEDPCAAKAWLITARTLYPADFTIQVILRRTSTAAFICISPSTSLYQSSIMTCLKVLDPLL